MTLDISDIVRFRKLVGRASAAGSVFALYQMATALLYFVANRYGLTVLFLTAGILLLTGSQLLRTGSEAAAKALPAAFAFNMVLTAREFLVCVESGSTSAKWVSGAITLLVFGPITVLIVGGIDTTIGFRRREFTEPFDFVNSFSTVQYLSLRPDERRRRILLLNFFIRGSEVLLLFGAFLVLMGGVFQYGGGGLATLLSLVGLACLALGVNLRLLTKQVAVTRIRNLLRDHPRSSVLLLRSVGDEEFKVPSRFSFKYSVTEYFRQLRLLRLINDSLSQLGAVVTCSDSTEVSSSDSALFVKTRVFRDSLRVMIVGKPEYPAKSSTTAPAFALLPLRLLVFPPVCDDEAKSRLESLCCEINDTHLMDAVPNCEIGRAVFLLLRQGSDPLLIIADRRDRWTYEVGLEVVIRLLQSEKGAGFRSAA